MVCSPALPHKSIFDQLSLTQMCYKSKFIIGKIFLIFDQVMEHLVKGGLPTDSMCLASMAT